MRQDFIAKLLLSLVSLLFLSWQQQATLAPADLRTFYPLSDEPQTILLQSSEANGGRKSFAYRLRNYQGQVVSEGMARVQSDRRVPIEVALSPGYYDLEFPRQGLTFGVVALPAVRRSDFFGIDAAMSWFAPLPMRPALSANIDRLGIGNVRERLRWGQINPQQGKWDWQTFLQYETLRRSYGPHRVIELVHDTPDWMPKTRGGRYPADLVATDEAWKMIAGRFSETWAALEGWNEPDMHFGGDQPSDQYVPYVRTLRHALQKAEVQIPLGGGVFSYLNDNFVELAARNELIDEVDFISFHYYGNPLEFETRVSGFRSWLARYGRESKPLWVTEAGKPWSRATPPTKNLLPDQVGKGWEGSDARPSHEEGASVALTHAMLAVEARACGIARYTPFLYLRLSERNKQFGMLDGPGTPMRALAAYATVVRVLNDASYIGDVQFDGASRVLRARAFEIGKNQAVIAAYTGNVGSNVVLNLPFRVTQALGVDGRPLHFDASGRITVRDGLVYLFADRGALNSVLQTDTEAARLTRVARAPVPDKASVADIVLQPVVPESTAAASNLGYLLVQGQNDFPMQVRVANLSTSAYTVQLHFGSSPEVAVQLAPRSMKLVNLKPRIADIPEEKGGIRYLDVQANAVGVKRIAPAVLALISEPSIEDALQNYAYRFKVPIEHSGRWKKNSSGNMKFNVSTDIGGGFGFQVSFNNYDRRWAFPRFTLPQNVDRDRIDGVLVKAKSARLVSVRFMSWDAQGRYSVTSKTPIIPADGKWHVAYIPLDSYLDTEDGSAVPLGRKLQDISVGFNVLPGVGTMENSIEVREIYLVGQFGQH